MKDNNPSARSPAAPPRATRRKFLRDAALTMSAFSIVPFQALGEASTDEKPGLAAESPKTLGAWELMLLDPSPPGIGETGSTAVGDIDGDGKQEIVIGGVGAMLW